MTSGSYPSFKAASTVALLAGLAPFGFEEIAVDFTVGDGFGEELF